MKKLKDTVVLITGSSSGIGAAAAKLFAKSGAKVVVNSKENTVGGKEVVTEIKNNGGQAIYIQADVSTLIKSSSYFRKFLRNSRQLIS